MIMLVLVLLTGGGLWAAGIFEEALYHMGLGDIPENPDAFKGRLNVLVMGLDTREGEDVGRADTIMLCSLDTEKNIMSILSIPRDTRVRIPGHGWEKINSATVFGGPSLAMKLVSELLGIRVNNYVMTDYEGFKKIVDALGGVTIDVKKEMYHHDPDYDGKYTIDIKPGLQRLNGEKALQYVRYRDYALGDIGRAEQQQRFLSALIKEVLQPSTVVRLPSLLMSTYKAVQTNLTLLEMKKLAVAAGKMNNTNLLTQTLPGKFLIIDGGSYWEPDPSLTRQVMAGILEGRAVNQVVLGETTVITTESQDPGTQKADGKVVPGQSGGVNTQKSGTSGTATKQGASTGTSGQTSTGSGAKAADSKKPASGGAATDGKTVARPGQSSGQSTTKQPSGGIVPPGGTQQDQQPVKNDQTPTVIIVPKTVAN
jgi:LCP family protein required for cell wall assembly